MTFLTLARTILSISGLLDAIILPSTLVFDAIPVNSVFPSPVATNPKLPKEVFEFVKSHCAPVPAKYQYHS